MVNACLAQKAENITSWLPITFSDYTRSILKEEKKFDRDKNNKYVNIYKRQKKLPK